MASPYDFDVVRVEHDGPFGPYEVDDSLKASGWNGGLWVRYVQMESYPDANNIRWVRKVGLAGPDTAVAFILRGSYEATDQYTSFYPKKTGVVSVCNLGQYLFKYYEVDDLAERTNPGTGSALVYTLNCGLYVSSNAKLTSEKETPTARIIGFCSGVPADNNNYLGGTILFP